MRVIISFTFIILMGISGASAQEDKPFLIQEKQESPHSLLWEISGNDLDEPSYVFGTIHLICNEYLEIEESLISALEQSDKLALELDMTDQEQMAQIQQLSMNEGGHNISSDLDPDVVEQLDNLIRPVMGVGMNQAGMMKPFVLQSMVMMARLGDKCEDGVTSYEEVLMELASEHDLEVAGLETAEFQISLFDNIPMDEQLEQLEKLVTDEDFVTDQFDKLFGHYISEDLKGMYQLFQEDEVWVQYKDDLLDTRNQAWISDMEELMTEQPVFFGVGAGHLPGQKGVLQLLEDEGYTVQPVH